MKSTAIIAIAFVLLIPISAYAEPQLELELKSVVHRGANELFITLEGKTEPNFLGDWFLVSADNEQIHHSGFTADENGDIFQTISTAGFSKYWVQENPTARLEVYRSEDFVPGNGGSINLQDRSKAILVKKVDLNVYISKQDWHDVLVSDNSFSTNKININLGDTIKFNQNCSDCPQLQIEFAPPPRPNTISGLNGVGIGDKFQFWLTGEWIISDIFNPNTKLYVNVIIPNDQNVVSSPETILQEYETLTQIVPPTLELDVEPSEQYSQKIPTWVKNIFGWYAQDQVSEDELLNAIKYLINEGILVVEMLESKKTDEKSELEIKAERLQKAHNNVVNSFKNKIPDPIDYGFDLELGFTNNEQKDVWCEIALKENREMNVLIFELDESLKKFENELNLSSELQEYIVEDEELLKRMIEHEKLSDKMIVDFDC